MISEAKKRLLEKKVKILSIISLVAASIITWYFSYQHGLVTADSDAMSHLDIARSIVDNKQPGFGQLGTVWLPLNHILFLVFIWNNWAWHSGFAGSFFSMLAYILGAIGIYKIIDELTDNFSAAIVGALVFALNPNILYLQSTPLTEPLYLVFFIFSVFFLVKFIKTDNLRYLLLLGVFGLLQVLTRYDGWFVTFAQGLILIYHQKFVRKVTLQEALGKFLLFAVPVVFGAALWFLWNALIFGNPLYFMFGANSAHAQQAIIQGRTTLIAKKNLFISFYAYWLAALDNIGGYLILLASLGVILFLAIKNKILDVKSKILVLAILLAPIVFNVLALYLGFSILNVPELHWYQIAPWFNARYGILALPLVAVSVGLLAEKTKRKSIVLLIALVIIVQSIVIYRDGIITIDDATVGASSGNGYTAVANVLSENVSPTQTILISATSYGSVIFQSGFPIKDFITEGDNVEWKEALVEPQDYADWVVMGNQNLNDTVYTALFENDSRQFLKNYIKVYCNASVCVYKKRTPAEMFVYTDGTNLKVANTNYIVKGVNDYDLAYQSTSTIDATLKNLSDIGVNTVRFWMFGDGNSNGFQPTAGIPNEARFESADYLIADASNYGIRLIPVLVNNWTDYGGEQQYLRWTGKNPDDQDLFYTNPETVSLFENYINHVIPRKNTVNGIPYSDDPTIMAWEVVNEPRYSASDTQAFVNWFSGVASYIRQEDPNHMVTVETDSTSFNQNGEPVIQDLCGQLAVTFCTAHLYLYNNNVLLYNNLSTVESNVKDYIKITNSDDKPFILGEVGVSKGTSPFGMQPLTALKTILNYNDGSSGALVWNWSDASDAAYGFSPLGTGGVYTLNDLSNVLGGIKPATVYFAPADANEGGYDVSTPEMELTETSTIPAQIAPPKATSTVVTAATTTPIAIPSIVPSFNTPGLSSTGTTTPQASSTSQSVNVDKSLPYSPSVLNSSDWTDGWGSFSVASGTLNVDSNASNTSGAIFLNGSNSWTNYILTAYVSWIKGDLFTLVARRSDDSNFIECVFSYDTTAQVQMGINMVSNNQSTPIAQSVDFIDTAAHLPYIGSIVSMTVQGNNVQCNMDNAIVSGSVSGNVLTHGGVGFETWDPQAGNSEIIVKHISVAPVAPPAL